MTNKDQQQLGKTLWNIADDLRGAMNADDFRDYMLSFLFLRYLPYTMKKQQRRNWERITPICQPWIRDRHYQYGMMPIWMK